MFTCFTPGAREMIIEVEERFAEAAQRFLGVLKTIDEAAGRAAPVHEVEELAWQGMLETTRKEIAAYIAMQDTEDCPAEITLEGKRLRRLENKRRRTYLSAFGPIAYERYVYATRETQRQEVIPLDAKLGMPKGDASYLLENWLGADCTGESYNEARESFRRIFGFAPSVHGLEGMVEQVSQFADTYFEEQEPVNPKDEEAILVATSDCKGVPMRRHSEETPKRKRLRKGEKNGRKRMACVGGVYSVAPFRRSIDDILDEILRKKRQAKRPKPKNKRLRAVLTREVDGEEVNGKDVIFEWLAEEVGQRNPQERRTVVAIMDGENKLRDLQEATIPGAVGILDIWHVTERLWKLAYCFHADGSGEAEAFVGVYLRKILEGKVGQVIGGLRQKATKLGLSKHKRQEMEKHLEYFDAKRAYMKYDEYLAQGFPIGSGVVEGACRHLVKDRMEQTGMRWEVEGAQAVLSLRAIYLNEDWDAFHTARIQQEQQTLYPYRRRLADLLNNAA
ncbi:MAG: ISKra4 family transposase [bacterium]